MNITNFIIILILIKKAINQINKLMNKFQVKHPQKK